ncbi:MAG: DUF1566 domain-containing protein [Bacteroidota bacterium]
MKTKKAAVAILPVLLCCGGMLAQSVGINDDGSNPVSSAMLDVSSTNKGFLPPRLTYNQRVAIESPVAGLIVWCSNCGPSGELQVYNGTIWTNLTGGAASGLPGAPTIGTATMGWMEASVSFTAPASDGGSTITKYTATSSPGSISGTLAQSGSGTITVTGLTNFTAYTFTVTATNATGTGAASAASNSITPGFYIGQSYGGGIVFYIDGTLQHALVAATSDQGAAQWGCYGTAIGGTSLAIGTGQANTTAIVNGCSEAGIAARICDNLVLNGYEDWFLPSREELNQLYLQRNVVGGFTKSLYWSSSESDGNQANAAWIMNFNWDASYTRTKNDATSRVRAVRAVNSK